jgi:predicted ATP-dependent serine protease
MAKEIGATVLLLTQLNDDGKTAGSRMITKDANQYWVLEYIDDGNRNVKICKNRRGAIDKVQFKFIGPCQKFLPKAI